MLAEEVRRCLDELDVPGMRRCWSAVVPFGPPPARDHDVLVVMHAARLEMKHLSRRARAYSQAWIDENHPIRVAAAVGVSVRAMGNRQTERSMNREGAMTHAVELAVRDGVDLLAEAPEVTRRMMAARARA